jgi:hypothetical protein
MTLPVTAEMVLAQPPCGDRSHTIRLEVRTDDIYALHRVKLLVLEYEHQFIEVDSGNALGVGCRQKRSSHARVYKSRVGVQECDDWVLVLRCDDASLRGVAH